MPSKQDLPTPLVKLVTFSLHVGRGKDRVVGGGGVHRSGWGGGGEHRSPIQNVIAVLISL